MLAGQVVDERLVCSEQADTGVLIGAGIVDFFELVDKDVETGKGAVEAGGLQLEHVGLMLAVTLVVRAGGDSFE